MFLPSLVPNLESVFGRRIWETDYWRGSFKPTLLLFANPSVFSYTVCRMGLVGQGVGRGSSHSLSQTTNDLRGDAEESLGFGQVLLSLTVHRRLGFDSEAGRSPLSIILSRKTVIKIPVVFPEEHSLGQRFKQFGKIFTVCAVLAHRELTHTHTLSLSLCVCVVGGELLQGIKKPKSQHTEPSD